MDKSNNSRNTEIELLRFIFASIVVLRHARSVWPETAVPFSFFTKGAFAVDFFFLLSGFLMMASVEKKACYSSDDVNLAKETITFLKGKVSGLYIELIISNLVGALIMFLTTELTIRELVKKVAFSIPSDYFFLHMWINSPSTNGPVWYISTMLGCMALIYPFLRKKTELMSKVFLPLCGFLLIGYLWFSYHSFLGPEVWTGLTYKGNVRGFAEISIGVGIYQASKVIKSVKLTTFAKLMLTYLKWFSYLFSFAWLIFSSNSEYQLFVLGLLGTGIFLTFSGQCLDFDFFKGKSALLFLGKFSTPLYLVHFFNIFLCRYLGNLNESLLEYHGGMLIVLIFYCSSIALAAFVMLVSGLLRKEEVVCGIQSIVIEREG